MPSDKPDALPEAGYTTARPTLYQRFIFWLRGEPEGFPDGHFFSRSIVYLSMRGRLAVLFGAKVVVSLYTDREIPGQDFPEVQTRTDLEP